MKRGTKYFSLYSFVLIVPEICFYLFSYVIARVQAAAHMEGVLNIACGSLKSNFLHSYVVYIYVL